MYLHRSSYPPVRSRSTDLWSIKTNGRWATDMWSTKTNRQNFIKKPFYTYIFRDLVPIMANTNYRPIHNINYTVVLPQIYHSIL